VLNLLTERGNLFIQKIDMGSLDREQAAVMLAYHPCQGLFEHGDLGAHAPTRPLRHRGRIRPAGD
jgi:hypothetical protein